MKIVADANILFSCLLKAGLTRRLWFHPELELIAPAFIVKEFLKYRNELLKKYSGSEEEFEKLLSRILAQMKMVDEEDLRPYLPAAASLSSDAKDWLYLACALRENAQIWSHDKGFKKQIRIIIKGTEELAGEMGLL